MGNINFNSTMGSKISRTTPSVKISLPGQETSLIPERVMQNNHTPNVNVNAKGLDIRIKKQNANVTAPSIVKQFKGVDFNESGFIPPDTMGAVGFKHVVNAVNGRISINKKKNGAVLTTTTLDDFWAPTGVITGGNFAFDPKILYDKLSNRFFIVSLAGTSSPNSWLLVGVSNPGDPFNWVIRAIDADIFNNMQLDTWADYPGLGLDNAHVYVTANMFSNAGSYQATKVWVFEKVQLYSIASMTWYEFYNPPGAFFTTQPTQVFNPNVSVQYLISRANLNSLQLNQITFSNGVPFWTQLQQINIAPLSSFVVPDAPQKNSPQLIDTGDTRLLQAIFQKGKIWTTHTVPSHDGSRAEVAWYQIKPSKSTPVQQGRIKHRTRSYYYPSLAVNSSNKMVIGFSGSSTKLFASAFFTGRLASDALGTTKPVTLLKAGQATYFLTDSIGRNRWGDYSATCVDPSNDERFWTVQEYVVSQNFWGTWWGAVKFL
ncbi:hypothetical protein [Priestia megaterium]|uniref:hypothetical protein n=1 Tax=Priestia megaterium TaxID=1404 RepID=UPI003EF00DC2